MGFLERPTNKSSNPTTKFLEWKNEQKCFSYYDKKTKETILVELPISFIVLEEYHTVKGFSDSDKTGIYSNEVLQTNSGELEVKTFKGRIIAKGLYKDIKEVVNASGGRYHKSLYVVTKDGELVNLAFKGAVVKKWSDFTQKGAWQRLKDEWVTITDCEDHKKGRVNYSTPNFKFDTSLNDKEFEMVKEQAGVFQDYMDTYFAKNIEVIEGEDFSDVDGIDDNSIDF